MVRGPRVAWSDRRAEVGELLKRHELEKVSFKQLALASGLPLPTLYAWIQRLRRERNETAAAASGDPGPRFVELAAFGADGRSRSGLVSRIGHPGPPLIQNKLVHLKRPENRV